MLPNRRRKAAPQPLESRPVYDPILTDVGHAALDYARLGWPVLPLKEDGPTAKAPYIRNGFKRASTDSGIIRSWWHQWPTALIGVALPAGVVVLDLDAPGALASLESVNGGPLPKTLTVSTGRGTHLYYKTSSRDISQRGVKGKHGYLPHVDVRAGGRGYVIVPPSIHPTTGRPYVWQSNNPIAKLPKAIQAACVPVAPRPRPTTPHRLEANANRFSGLLDTVTRAPQGQRNRTLFWAACRMSTDEARGLTVLWDDLAAAAHKAGLPASEISATITSAKRQAVTA